MLRFIYWFVWLLAGPRGWGSTMPSTSGILSWSPSTKHCPTELDETDRGCCMLCTPRFVDSLFWGFEGNCKELSGNACSRILDLGKVKCPCKRLIWWIYIRFLRLYWLGGCLWTESGVLRVQDVTVVERELPEGGTYNDALLVVFDCS